MPARHQDVLATVGVMVCGCVLSARVWQSIPATPLLSPVACVLVLQFLAGGIPFLRARVCCLAGVGELQHGSRVVAA
jgi:hypothetical protein